MKRILSIALMCSVPAALGAQVRSDAVAQRLTDHDIAEIGKLATAVGKPVWLLEGDVSRVPPFPWSVNAYLEPDSNAGVVQRGRVVQVQSENVNFKPVKWRQTSTRPYARVGSANPFILDTSLSDDELISLLAYLRTSPLPATKTNGEGVDGTLPVSGIRQDGYEVLVGLRRNYASGQNIWLIRERGQWLVVRVLNWVL